MSKPKQPLPDFIKSQEAQSFIKTGEPRELEPADTRITLYLTESEYQAIKRACFNDDIKMSVKIKALAVGWAKKRLNAIHCYNWVRSVLPVPESRNVALVGRLRNLFDGAPGWVTPRSRAIPRF